MAVQHNDLWAALNDPGILNTDFTLSPALEVMFRRQFSDVLGDNGPLEQRFARAQEIIRDMTTNQAVFYSIRDMENHEADYAAECPNVGANIDNAIFAAGGVINRVGLSAIFAAESVRLNLIAPMTDDIRIQIQICDHYVNDNAALDDLLDAINVHGDTAVNWFADNAQLNQVETLADQSFYRVANVDNAIDEGRVYGPGPIHNWGMNCAWVLGLVRRGAIITSLSSVIPAYQDRGHPPPMAPLPNPSAFALEMSIAFTAGYSLEYTHATGAIRYLSTNAPTVEMNMDGTEGHGLLQSRANQSQIYQEVMAAINNGINLVNWVPPTIRNQNAANLHALVVADDTQDLRVASHPHAAAADLLTIAGRTHDPAILLEIANNPNADALTLTAVANNPDANAQALARVVTINNANDALVAAHQHADPAELKTIADRTNDPLILLDAVNNLNANPAVRRAVANNPDANAQALTVIVAAGHANDEFVAAHAHADPAELKIIAERTHDPLVLTAVANAVTHGPIDPGVRTAVIENIQTPFNLRRDLIQQATAHVDLHNRFRF